MVPVLYRNWPRATGSTLVGIRLHVASIDEITGARSAPQLLRELSVPDAVGRHLYEPDADRADAILSECSLQGMLGQLSAAWIVQMLVEVTRDSPRRSRKMVFPHPTSSSRSINRDEVEPDLLLPSRGALTHPVRAKLLGLSHPRAVLEPSDDNMFSPGQKVGSTAAAHRQHFFQLVELSKFVLCPRGHGFLSFRLYEVLATGRVPVIIKDGWLPPARLDWERSVVRVRECDAGVLPRRLGQLEERWDELAGGARSVAAKLERDRLWDHYAESVDQLANQPRRASPFGRRLVYQRRAHLLARRLRNASA